MVTDLFEIASATVPGREHVGRNGLLFGRNNQDGTALRAAPGRIVAVVTDGCGSAPWSEVGARLGAPLLVSAIERQCRRGDIDWTRVRDDVLAHLRVLALEIAGEGSFTDTIRDYFLFTAICAVVTPARTQVTAIGDGLVAVNGEVTVLEPQAGNRPPYLAYSLIESDASMDPELLAFREVAALDTGALSSLLIATDGAVELRDAAERTLPGTAERVGELSNLWTSDRFFRNRDALRRRLALINSSVTYRDGRGDISTAEGLLADDTSVIVIRRRACAAGGS